MAEPDTLIDQIYAATFGKPDPAWKSNKLVRRVLTEARRFILDNSMASFMADITCAAMDKRTHTLTAQAEHQMRRSARLPHAVSWFEYDLLKYCARAEEIVTDGSPYEPRSHEKEIREGWLLNGFDESDQEFCLHLFHRIKHHDGTVHIKTLPFGLFWRTDEGKPQGHIAFSDPKGHGHDDDRLYTIILGCKYPVPHEKLFPQVTVGPGELLTPLTGPFRTGELFCHATGIFRRLWALLATINDIPVLMKSAQAAKGFTAKAQYRRFLEHKTIYLHVPQQEDRRKIARSVVAAAKRRAHTVRGHWRKDWRHPSERLWIKEHQRGDASLGFVTHDYQVLH